MSTSPGDPALAPEANYHARMSRLQRAWVLFKSSWGVIRTDRELLMLPVISALVSGLVAATFLVPAAIATTETTGFDQFGNQVVQTQPSIVSYVLLFAFYFVSAFVVIFFNAALVFGANLRFDGQDPTISRAIAGARAHVGTIFQWSLVSATVSMIIRQLQERGGLLGRLVGAVAGIAWSVVTFLVLPMLVIEGVGVKEAFTRSAQAVKQTWGENVAGQGGIGLISFLATIPILLVIGVGFALTSSSAALGVPVIVLGVVALLAMIILTSAMSTIYQTALFRFATNRPIPGFQQELLSGAFATKGRNRNG
jgi:hypothetical protein